MRPLPNTQSVWALNESANGVISIARGLLEAATTDDVNPVALLSCESFGAILPLNSETRLKIEQLAGRSHTTHVIQFIKASVGYKLGDSVQQLSKSEHGIRFLCLAAALCTMDKYEAALRFDSLLEATQKERQLRPTISQLQTMMAIVEKKMILSDFAETVAGWEIWYRGLGAQSTDMTDYQLSTAAEVPSRDGLQSLILAMSESNRLGEECSINLRTNSPYVPWCIAFIKWCLGIPPSIRLSNGSVILEQEKSSIDITITPNSPGRTGSESTTQAQRQSEKTAFEISTARKVGKLKSVIIEGPPGRKLAWRGMMEVKTWMDYRLATFFDRFPILRSDRRLKAAVGQALNFILNVLPSKLAISSNYQSMELSWLRHFGDFQSSQSSIRPSAFPDKLVRTQLAEQLLGDSLPLTPFENDLDQILRPDKLNQIISGGCNPCKSLNIENKGSRRLPFLKSIGGDCPCKINEFLEEVGSIGADLLVLSLLGDPNHLESFPMVKAGPLYNPNPWHRPLYPIKKSGIFRNGSFLTLITSGWQVLMHGKCEVLACDSLAIFRHAAKLLNHRDISDSTIVSSGSGQVLYPAFFDWNTFIRNGYFQLNAFQGDLQWQGMSFDVLIDSYSHEIHNDYQSDNDRSVDTEEEDESHDGSVAAVESMDIEHANNEEVEVEMTEGDDNDDEIEDIDQVNVENPEGFEEVNETVTDVAERQLDAEEPDVFLPKDFRADVRSHYSHETIEWKLSVIGSELFGEVVKPLYSARVFAWNLFDALHRSILTPFCRHKGNKTAGDLGPLFLMTESRNMIRDHERKTLISSHWNYAHQLLALEAQSETPPCVVHLDGCIHCALKLCIDLDCGVVIS